MEIDTAARHQAPVLIVVANNGGWAIEVRDQQETHGKVVGTRLQFADHAAMARAFGLHGERVERAEDLPGGDRARAGEPAGAARRRSSRPRRRRRTRSPGSRGCRTCRRSPPGTKRRRGGAPAAMRNRRERLDETSGDAGGAVQERSAQHRPDRLRARAAFARQDRDARFAPRVHVHPVEPTRVPARKRARRPRPRQGRPSRGARLQPRRVDGDLRSARQGGAGHRAAQFPPDVGPEIRYIARALRRARADRAGRARRSRRGNARPNFDIPEKSWIHLGDTAAAGWTPTRRCSTAASDREPARPCARPTRGR